MHDFEIVDVSVFIDRSELQQFLSAQSSLGLAFVSSVIVPRASVEQGGEVLRLFFRKVQ